ncbi:interleukin-18 receptor accessory protein-like isoform X2 [Anguilla anguilla]|uniref:interleukin-18 receptor accessory protein-like isoform X2 n=1 Tax=Anguilla anguilla TaxID=7936 RepID=UPI0015A93A3E|nr:interleukin-18 receptor accessory protein-like isoform X2 [Anguilla anguilla]
MVYEHTLAVVVVAVLLQEWLCEFRGVCSSSVLYAYKALDGERFVMQCASPHQPYLFNKSGVLERRTEWFRHEGENKKELPGVDDSIVKVGNSLWFSRITERHSGNYSCYTRNVTGTSAVGWGREGVLHFLVDVLQRNKTACHDYGESEVTLILGQGGSIVCPDVKCYTSAPKGAIRWYKNAVPAEKLSPSHVELQDSQLYLITVYEEDNANFTCDLSYVDGLHWTVRRTVRARAIPQDIEDLPHILYPHGNETEEAELGKPHILTCKVQFGFERNSRALITWWVRYHDNGSMEPLEMGSPEKVGPGSFWEQILNRSAHLQQVTHRHLGATFICRARNSRGNATATIRLQRRAEVAGLLLVILWPAVTVVFVTGISVLVRTYWLEIYLLCRTYLPLEETVSGKEYDAFVSCVSGSSSDEEDSKLTGETLGLHHLPNVLEKQYGYRLCLLQRDLVPGGVYTEDVVWSMQRSRRVICVLSSCYLRSSCLFELETSLEALQHDRGLRLILVWSSPAPPCLAALPLPPTVRRALRVLPALHWSPSHVNPSHSPFWKTLKRAMPISPLPPPSISALSPALREGLTGESPET